jgi:hypothetical protein
MNSKEKQVVMTFQLSDELRRRAKEAFSGRSISHFLRTCLDDACAAIEGFQAEKSNKRMNHEQ